MENEEQITVCKFCLNSCECTLEDVEGVTTEMLGMRGIELDSNTIGKLIICKTCSENLRKCFDFKTMCLNTENCINSLRGDRNNENVKINEFYLRKNETENITMSKCHATCRLCMEIAESRCISLNEGSRDILAAKAILGRYFPELDLEATKNPVICTSCNKSLHCYNGFINSCFGMENKVKKYYDFEASGNKPHFETNNMLPFELKNTSNYENGSSGINTLKNCNDNTLYDGITLKYENLMQTEYQELHIKHETNEHEELHDVKAGRISDLVESYHEREQNSGTDVKCENLVVIKGYRINSKHEEIDIKREDEESARFPDNAPILQDALAVDTHQCNICKKYLPAHGDVSNVVLRQCEECDYKTKTNCCLDTQKLIHRNDSKATISQCDLTASEEIHRAIETPSDNTSALTYSCEKCTYKAKRKYNLNRHMLTHSPASEVTLYFCEICTYKAQQRYDLNRHMLSHNTTSEVTMYSCGKCTHKTKYKSNLKLHMLIHKDASEVTVYSCEICAHKATRKGDLQQHMLTHKNTSEITMYSCGICTYKAKYKRSLNSHNMLMHRNASEVPMYSCEKCTYNTNQKCHLQRHMLIHKNASEVKMHSCGTCTYKSKHKDNLKTHMLTHKNTSEVITFSCELCTYNTKRKNGLNQHMLTHKQASELTTYSCAVCPYKTKWKGNLKQHMLIHRYASKETV